MLFRFRYISLVALASTMFGCNDGDIIELPELQSKIVLWSVNNVDYVWSAMVSQSLPVLDEKFAYTGIPNATVSIYENGTLLVTLAKEPSQADNISWFTTTSHRPVAGRTYEIRASAPGFEPVSATYVQPLLSPQIDDFKVTGKAASNFQNRVDAEITLTDLPGETYYELSIQATDSLPEKANYFAGMNVFGADLQALGGVGEGSMIFPDESFQGKKITIRFNAYESPSPTLHYYTVYVRAVSKEYYDCIKTLTRQSTLGRDPYATPLRVKGNVKNGFGLFTGYSQSQQTVEY